MKYLITLLVLSLLGCLSDSDNKSSIVYVEFTKAESTSLKKESDTDDVFQVDTFDLGKIENEIETRYHVTTATEYNVSVSGAVTCDTKIGQNVTDDVTIDSLVVITQLLKKGCNIEIDVKTDTLAYARRMALQHKWDIVRNMVGDTLTDSTLVATYIRGVWQNNTSIDMISLSDYTYADQYRETPLLQRFTLNITKEISYDFLSDESLNLYRKYYIYHFIRLDRYINYDMLNGLDINTISTDVFDPYPYGPLKR